MYLFLSDGPSRQEIIILIAKANLGQKSIDDKQC